MDNSGGDSPVERVLGIFGRRGDEDDFVGHLVAKSNVAERVDARGLGGGRAFGLGWRGGHDDGQRDTRRGGKVRSGGLENDSKEANDAGYYKSWVSGENMGWALFGGTCVSLGSGGPQPEIDLGPPRV